MYMFVTEMEVPNLAPSTFYLDYIYQHAWSPTHHHHLHSSSSSINNIKLFTILPDSHLDLHGYWPQWYYFHYIYCYNQHYNGENGLNLLIFVALSPPNTSSETLLQISFTCRKMKKKTSFSLYISSMSQLYLNFIVFFLDFVSCDYVPFVVFGIQDGVALPTTQKTLPFGGEVGFV